MSGVECVRQCWLVDLGVESPRPRDVFLRVCASERSLRRVASHMDNIPGVVVPVSDLGHLLDRNGAPPTRQMCQNTSLGEASANAASFDGDSYAYACAMKHVVPIDVHIVSKNVGYTP